MSDHSNYSKIIADLPDEIGTDDWENNNESADINIKEKSGDELLIELYKKRSFLYDKNNANFKDSSMKQNAWIEISKVMIQTNCGDMYTPSYCQKRCISLRDQYSREKRKAEIETKNRNIPVKTTRFPFFSQLAFLDCVIKRRRSYTNCTKSQSNIIDEDSIIYESQTVMNESCNNENGNLNKQRLHNTKNFYEKIAPKIKKQKVNEIKESEQTIVQINHGIPTYMEKKILTADDAFMEFIKVQFNSIPENEKNIRRKMIMDALTVSLSEKTDRKECKCYIFLKNCC